MEDFTYKEYTAEETRIYNEALPKIIAGIKSGLKFHDACETLNIADKKLKEFIMDDALKIIIAELHYTQGYSLQEVADTLSVPAETIQKANGEMLEDIEITSGEVYKLANPDASIGNA